jgi:hypothetical protein
VILQNISVIHRRPLTTCPRPFLGHIGEHDVEGGYDLRVGDNLGGPRPPGGPAAQLRRQYGEAPNRFNEIKSNVNSAWIRYFITAAG